MCNWGSGGGGGQIKPMVTEEGWRQGVLARDEVRPICVGMPQALIMQLD